MTARRHVDHVCAVCGSDCDTVTGLKRRVRLLEMDVQRLAFALVEARELRAWATDEIERRFPEERAA